MNRKVPEQKKSWKIAKLKKLNFGTLQISLNGKTGTHKKQKQNTKMCGPSPDGTNLTTEGWLHLRTQAFHTAARETREADFHSNTL